MPFMRLIPSGNSHPTRGQYRSNTTRYRLEATHLAQTNRIAFRKKLVVLANEASRGIGSFDVVSGLVADRSASPVAANTTVRKLLNTIFSIAITSALGEGILLLRRAYDASA